MIWNEIEFAKSYVELQRIRFENRFYSIKHGFTDHHDQDSKAPPGKILIMIEEKMGLDADKAGFRKLKEPGGVFRLWKG